MQVDQLHHPVTGLRRLVDDAFRGRVFAFYDVVFNAAFVLAALLAVLLWPKDGVSRWLFAGSATTYLATAVVYANVERGTRQLPVVPTEAAASTSRPT